MKRIEDILRDFWDNIKCTNIHNTGVPEGEERMNLRKCLKRKWLKISVTWERMHRELQAGLTQGGRHVLIKLTKIKDKDKLLKATRGK